MKTVMILALTQHSIGMLVAAVCAGIVLAIFFFAKEPKTLAITFATVALSLSALLLWLILRPR